MKESLFEKRRRLTADIAQQRTALAAAFRDLERPFQYTEQAMRGFGFLRQNPWVLSVVPAVFSIVGSVVGIVRNKPTAKAARWGRKAARETEREAKRESRSLLGHATHWGGRGWKAYQFYRRLRKLL